MATNFDVVIVGGGIAGGAMAAKLGRAGLGVLLLERQTKYQDRVRGEFMVPWGVAEAQRLGLLDVLEAGANWISRRIPYDETIAPEQAEAATFDFSKLLPGVRGALGFGHPAACLALNRAAAAAGAEVRMGVGSVTILGGARPEITYQTDGNLKAARCRLVIGADGRTSSVRGQAGIRLEKLPAEHLITGLLVDGAEGWSEDVFAVGTEGNVTYVICPQGLGRVRLYLCHALRPHDRFAGPRGAASFLRSYHLSSVPHSDSLATATVAGPCATLQGDDTWTERPFTEGVALIGDAGGYNNPLLGQGLSLAMRDVRVLSELLLSCSDWSPGTLQPYADERTERLRRVRFVAGLLAGVFAEYTPEAAEQRRLLRPRMASDPTLSLPVAAVYMGPENAPPEAFTQDFRERFFGPASA